MEVSTLHNTIISSPINLNTIESQIFQIKQQLNDLENNSRLKNYGYKPWINEESVDQSLNNLEIDSNIRPDVEKSSENTINANKLLSMDEMTVKSIGSDEQTFETVKYIPIANQEMSENESKPKDNKLDKYLGRTPQPYDFGITRRFTFVPQLFLNNHNNYKSNSPQNMNNESTNTCRFNYLTNNFNLQSNANPITPPNASLSSVNGGDSFVTVEFTPGLTTKRPKGISRVKANPKEEKTNANANHFSQVLQSVENEKITPEQPIPSIDSSKSTKLLKSINKTGTPPLPQTRVDLNLHNRLLKKK